MSSFLNQIAKINDHLYLSSFVGATESNVNRLGITCVITVCKEVPKLNLKHVESIKLEVLDRPNESLAKYFDYVADKIKDVAERNGSVLVHCVAGVSRSATIVLAYLMKHNKMMLRDAHDYVKSKRPFIRPNLGFWKQLVEYEAKIFGRNSVKIVWSNIGWIPDIYENEAKNMAWMTNASSSLSKSPRFLGGLSNAFANLSFSSSSSSSNGHTSSSTKENNANTNKQEKSSPPLPQKIIQSPLMNPSAAPKPIAASAFSKQHPLTNEANSISLVIKKIDSNVYKPQSSNTASSGGGGGASQYQTTYRTSYQKHS